MTIRLLAMAVVLIMLAACASIGRPEGGARDETPPVFVRSNPAPGALNVSSNKIEIFFDENIKVEDVINKVVVSPVQTQTPSVVANGHRLVVELRDTLIPDATYTIDLSDAVRDLNEGNVLDGFATDFSTGATRDSLVIAGMLFEARSLEPAQGMLVGIHSNLDDSALTTLPFERVARTNQLGQFAIRNLAPGNYRLYALNDVNRDYKWDRSEDVAFYDSIITPRAIPAEITDTLRASDGSDSIRTRPGVKYLPNDILMTWFNENYRSQYLKNYTRPDSMRINIELGAPSDTFPEFTIINGEAAGARLDSISRINYSSSRDTLDYWLTDPRVIVQDTLILASRYLKTDSLNQLSWTNDTIRLVSKFRQIEKDKKKEKEKEREKQRKKRKENGDSLDLASDSLPELTFIEFRAVSGQSQELNKPLQFSVSQPVDTIIQRMIRLEILTDTVWNDLGHPAIVRDSVNHLLDYYIHNQWEPGCKYRFTADSAAIHSIYGHWNKQLVHEFTVKTEEDYSTISFNISGAPDSAAIVVELLSSDKTIASAPVIDGTARFEYVAPAAYYARAFIDANKNGQWDTGSIAAKRQPEDVYYYTKKLNVKKNWDITQNWNLSEVPIDLQKPADIKKNKPKTKGNEQDSTTGDEEDEEENLFNTNIFGGTQTVNSSGLRATQSR